MAEERDPDLNEEEDIRLDEIREKHWRYVDEKSNNTKKINALWWELYVKWNQKLMKRNVSVSVPHPKGGGIVWTYVKDHIIDEKEDYKDIGLRGFYYKLFEEEEGWGTREDFYGYPYLKHLIQFWPGDWAKQTAKTNEAVGIINPYTMNGKGKILVRHFKRQYFWKYIGYIISEVTYGKK